MYIPYMLFIHVIIHFIIKNTKKLLLSDDCLIQWNKLTGIFEIFQFLLKLLFIIFVLN